MKKIYLLSLIFIFTSLVINAKNKSNNIYVMVTDYVTPDGKTDLADAIQKIIDENPHRTIYFSDGVYMLSHSLNTPADPNKAVHLVLANFAVLKAADNWSADGGALVRVGGKDPYNSITINGSNYGIEGGIFDGNGKADGISIDSGRESRLNHISIKNTMKGIYIKKGANNGSSDSDICDVNIVGNGDPNSIGVLVEGYDNTFTNMRIANINTGVWLKSGGNRLTNIHPLGGKNYKTSCAFIINNGNCWLDYCYSDQFKVGFKISKGKCVNLTDCFAFWYNGKVESQTAIECDGPLDSFVYGLHVGGSFCENANLLIAEPGGKGSFECISKPNIKFSAKEASQYYLK